MDQANQQNNARNDQINGALDLQKQGFNLTKPALEDQVAAIRKMFGMAQGYDPAAESRDASNHASDVTASMLHRALGNLNADYRAGGGTPGNSTEFNVNAQGLTDRIADPLREFAAQQKASEFSRKMAAYQAATGAPIGQVGNSYSQFANSMLQGAGAMPQGDASGSMNLLSSALMQLLGGHGGGGSAGNTSGIGDPNFLRDWLNQAKRGIIVN
jgi:hypothetical protein